MLVFAGEFEKEIDHPQLGVIRRSTKSIEYYWKDKWFNIFRFHEPEGDLRNYYCNINKPPTFENRSLNYIDLDIDVLVWPDFSFEVLDLDEFERNSKQFTYDDELRNKVNQSLNELRRLIREKGFPFNYSL